MKIQTLILTIAFALLFGCAAQVQSVNYHDLSSEALSSIRGMTQLPELALSDGTYTDVGVVEGLSCRRNKFSDAESGSSASMSMAVEQLKLKAAALGADHITTAECVQNDKMDLSNNCWSTLICTSHALKTVTANQENQI